jgi:hypothetical protein
MSQPLFCTLAYSIEYYKYPPPLSISGTKRCASKDTGHTTPSLCLYLLQMEKVPGTPRGVLHRVMRLE